MRIAQLRYLIKNNSHPNTEGKALEYAILFIDRFVRLAQCQRNQIEQDELADMLAELDEKADENDGCEVINLFTREKIE